jgi:hypothetical protein
VSVHSANISFLWWVLVAIALVVLWGDDEVEVWEGERALRLHIIPKHTCSLTSKHIVHHVHILSQVFYDDCIDCTVCLE